MEQKLVDESLIFELDPLTEVVVSNERPRQRRDLGEIEKMALSIKTFGQLQPIVVSRNKELIAGGRRLAACIMNGIKVRACFKDTIDPTLMRELELEENIQRKALNPAEEAAAVKELVEIKQKIHGTPTQGREGGFTLNDAAETLGKSKAYIIDMINLATAVEAFPELGKLDSKNEIKKAYKGLERVQQQVTALATYEQTIKKDDRFIIVNRSAEEYLHGLGDASVDLFFTDPPYGIDIHDLAMTLGGETGGTTTTSGIKYEDSEGYAKGLLEILCNESYRITKANGHAFIFCAPSHFQWLSDRMAAAGWIVAPRPVIWIKRETGQNNQPERWFSSAYEFVLFARKQDSRLVLQGRPDWIQCDPVLPSERVHQAEKPVALCKELISRVCLPGQIMIDPCMGSGALVEAGVQMKLKALGSEKMIESYAAAVTRMEKLKKEE